MNGLQIRIFLKENGFSVAEVARRLGKSQQNLQAILSRDNIKTGVIEDIERVTGLSLKTEPQPSTDEPQALNTQQLTELVQSLTETVRLQQETIAHLVGVKSASIAPPPRKMKSFDFQLIITRKRAGDISAARS